MSITISNQDQMRVSDAYGLSLYLVPMEHRILDLQKSGKTVKDIADSLDLSPTEVYRRLDIISNKIKSQRLRENSHGA
jgi:DNA-binding CsgD family transcriptional regulator